MAALLSETITKLDEPLRKREGASGSLQPPRRYVGHEVVRDAVFDSGRVPQPAGLVLRVQPVLELELAGLEGHENEGVPEVVVFVREKRSGEQPQGEPGGSRRSPAETHRRILVGRVTSGTERLFTVCSSRRKPVTLFALSACGHHSVGQEGDNP